MMRRALFSPGLARPRDVARRVEVALAVALGLGALCAALALHAQRFEGASGHLRPRLPRDDGAEGAARDDLALRPRPVVLLDKDLAAGGCRWATRAWTFPGHSLERARDLVARALRDAASSDLLSATMRCDGAGCFATPPLSLVEAIPRDARARLYVALDTAVFLLGGLVFNKNGLAPTQPWYIDRAEDVLTDYPETHAVTAWRPRDAR